MGYYNIRILTASQEMTTIVAKFGKLKYNHLPMEMCAPGDIFQDKVDGLLGDIEGVKTYINDKLALSKERLSKHIEQPRIIFGRLCASGLKVNAPKCSFGLNKIPCIGYVITRKGIKPNPNKVKGVLDIGRPTTTTEA